MEIKLKNSKKQCWINPEDITAGIKETTPAQEGLSIGEQELGLGQAFTKYSILIGGVWFTVADEAQFNTLISNIKDVE